MTEHHQQLRELLVAMEQELRLLSLWEEQAPSQQALSSNEPFCVDTLALSQWLQWLLIPRMHRLLDESLPLPNQCNIHAIAEESFKELEADSERLLELIQHFDRTLTRPH